MTPRRDLEQHLVANGCERVRQGAKHDVWRSPSADAEPEQLRDALRQVVKLSD